MTSFAYPFGTRAHYTRETAELVRRAGLASACANLPSPVERGTDPFEIPRRIVPDVDGEKFAELLESWLDD